MLINETVDNLFHYLQDYSRSELIVGKPIMVGEITLIPLIEVGVGLGNGDLSGKRRENLFSGLAMGVKISPSSVLVIQGEKVSAIALKEKSALDRVAELLPQILNEQ